MRVRSWLLVLCLCLLLPTLLGCGNNGDSTREAAVADTGSIDACSLLTQEEVDSLFPASPGPGRPDSPGQHVSGCVWPAEKVPGLMLQVVPAPASVREGVDLGEGYEVVELQELSGPAAVSIQKGDPKYEIAEGVAMLGIVKGERMVTLSPVTLNIKPGTQEFERLKELADKAAQRL